MRKLPLDPSDPQDVKDFVAAFRDETEIGIRLQDEGYFNGAVLELIHAEATRRFGHADVTMKEFEHTANRLYLTGAFIVPVVEAPPEPEVPVDKLGRPLSPKALRWRDYRIWSHAASMKEVEARKRTDREYAEFVASEGVTSRNQSQMATDRVTPIGFHEQVVASTPELKRIRDWANMFRALSMEEANRLRRRATNPDADEFNAMLDRATELGFLNN